MRQINAKNITATIRDLCLKANFALRSDVLSGLRKAYKRERIVRARKSLAAIIENATIAKSRKLALCQDTGLPTVFVWLGQDVHISGDMNAAINRGIAEGYKQGFLRDSIVRDPLLRGHT